MSRESGGKAAGRFSLVCCLTALAHIAAALVAVYVVREGNFLDTSPTKLLQFVPDHVLVWRVLCLLLTLASLSFVTFVVCAREILSERAGTLATLAVVFAAIGAANSLHGVSSMMVLFSDLALHFRTHGGFLVHETYLLSWATVDQALSQCLLIGNSLYALAGMLIVSAALFTKSFPAWLAWTGAPIWVVTLAVSVLSFLGMLNLVLMVTMATVLVFVAWCLALSIHFFRVRRRAD